METLNKVRLNNVEEYNKLFKEELIGGFCCFGFHDKPTHYPCILVYKDVDYGDDESILGAIIYSEDLL